MMRAKLNEMSSQGWELVSVAAGVESADKERDAIFITRFFSKKKFDRGLSRVWYYHSLFFAIL